MNEPECTCCDGAESEWFNGKCERHPPVQRPFFESTEIRTWTGPPANLQNLPKDKKP